MNEYVAVLVYMICEHGGESKCQRVTVILVMSLSSLLRRLYHVISLYNESSLYRVSRLCEDHVMMCVSVRIMLGKQHAAVESGKLQGPTYARGYKVIYTKSEGIYSPKIVRI